MKNVLFILTALFTATAANAYEIPDENEVPARTCRLTVKIEVIRDETLERPSGRAVVTAQLFDGEGNPYRGERINFSATAGTFVCRLPEDSTSGDTESSDDCFVTGDDGTAKPYLINIPYNRQVSVKAVYSCDERLITAAASMSISRERVKGRKAIKR